MSLYADEELGGASDLVDAHSAPSSSTAPSDPGQALAAALTLPAETPAQAEALAAAGLRYEEQPSKLPELCGRLLPMVVDGGESLLRSWTLEMVGLAVGRSALQVDVKSSVAQSSLDALNRLLLSNSVPTIKAVIPIFSTIHPILFRIFATSRPPQIIYDLYRASKARILSFALDPNAQPANRGIKAAAWKYIQRVLLTGTRSPTSDPRLQRGGGSGADPSIAMVGRDSALNIPELEEEAKMLQTQLVTQMFSSTDPAVLNPIFHTFPVLCKSRPPLAALLVPSMAAWTPAALEAAGKPAMQIRAVEKTLRLVMGHLIKLHALVSFSSQLNDAIIRQKQRMELAFVAEQEERRVRRTQIKPEPIPSQPALGKHPLEAESSADGAKRTRLEVQPGSGRGKGVEFDVSTLPLDGVIEAVMAGLGAVTAEHLQFAFSNARKAIEEDSPDAVYVLAASLGAGAAEVKEDEDEVLNPLDMDLDDDDLLLAEPLLEEAEEEAITLTEFHLPKPQPLDNSERDEMVSSALERICLSGNELAGLPDVETKDGVALAVQPKEAWMLLMVRLATRGPAGKRKAVVDFVSSDFSARSKLAAVWLNEEWYNDILNRTSNYPSYLDSILSSLLPTIDAKDRSLSTFLSSLPQITPSVITTLTALCEESERGIVGFLALRDLIEARPPVRQDALTRLLELCTHADRKIRYPAIRTVSRWVPDTPMAGPVTAYALGILRRLVPDDKDTMPTDADDLEDGEQAEERVESRFLGEVNEDTVQQHVELAFALSRRNQDLLDDIFRIYPKLDPVIAEAVESLLTPLVQSLGATPRLLEVLRHFPTGAEKLALRVVTILSAGGASTVLVNLVKGLMGERELDPRFIIPIIGELDKAEIEKQIPRIVSLLGTSDSRDLVRTAFAAVLQKMTPADLLVSLHEEEGARKATIEAIGICFSMTTVFRSDVLATSLSRITDLPTLPVVFLRTTIQAVSTYKSLVPFIANNILPKLVTKKIWEQPPLWDGFVRLAKMIAPASFGSMLQLPKEWLKDLLDKQPGLKTGLKAFLAGKGQKNALAELFGDEAQ